jgi:hypothetical protein
MKLTEYMTKFYEENLELSKTLSPETIVNIEIFTTLLNKYASEPDNIKITDDSIILKWNTKLADVECTIDKFALELDYTLKHNHEHSTMCVDLHQYNNHYIFTGIRTILWLFTNGK